MRPCQDEDGREAKRLSRWFAGRPGARWALRCALLCPRGEETAESVNTARDTAGFATPKPKLLISKRF